MLSGLPFHPLIAHAVVVCVPLAAIGTILMAFWPAAARRLWPAVLFIATVALISVPLTTSSGESLEEKVGENELVETHAEQGEKLLPFVIALWLAAAGICLSIYLSRRRAGQGDAGQGDAGQGDAGQGDAAAPNRRHWRIAVAVGLALLALVGGVGGTVVDILAGHSGAKAVWTKRGTASQGTDTDQRGYVPVEPRRGSFPRPRPR